MDDMAGVEKLRQWCTMVKDRSKCADMCGTFGDRMCAGKGALKYDHDDFCRRGDELCKCCCQPVCKGGGGGAKKAGMKQGGGPAPKMGESDDGYPPPKPGSFPTGTGLPSA